LVPILEAIRIAANKSAALGSERFKAEVEGLTCRRMAAKKMGKLLAGGRKKRLNAKTTFDSGYSIPD